MATVFCSLLALGEGGILNLHFSRFIVRLLRLSAYFRYFWLRNFFNWPCTLCSCNMLAFVHLLPIALNLVVRDRRDILQDQVMIYVLNEAVLAKLVWFLWLVEYVFHDDLVDLVCLTHSRKSAAFGLFNFRLELLKLTSDLNFSLDESIDVFRINATKLKLDWCGQLTFCQIDNILLRSLELFPRSILFP